MVRVYLFVKSIPLLMCGWRLSSRRNVGSNLQTRSQSHWVLIATAIGSARCPRTSGRKRQFHIAFFLKSFLYSIVNVARRRFFYPALRTQWCSGVRFGQEGELVRLGGGSFWITCLGWTGARFRSSIVRMKGARCLLTDTVWNRMISTYRMRSIAPHHQLVKYYKTVFFIKQ